MTVTKVDIEPQEDGALLVTARCSEGTRRAVGLQYVVTVDRLHPLPDDALVSVEADHGAVVPLGGTAGLILTDNDATARVRVVALVECYLVVVLPDGSRASSPRLAAWAAASSPA